MFKKSNIITSKTQKYMGMQIKANWTDEQRQQLGALLDWLHLVEGAWENATGKTHSIDDLFSLEYHQLRNIIGKGYFKNLPPLYAKKLADFITKTDEANRHASELWRILQSAMNNELSDLEDVLGYE